MRRVYALSSFALVALLCAPALAGAASRRAPLPTEADVIPIAPGEETILFGDKAIETLLPGDGRVDDREVVSVAVAPDGTPVTVGVRQRLVLHGLGDFRFKVSGPAQDVEALPASEAEPGLRKGAVLWQGFSDGRKVLASEMNMFPEEEAQRLPLKVSAQATVDGAPVDGEATGDYELTVTVSNVSGGPVTTTSALGDPAELAGALDAVADRLRAGERPRPGHGGIPKQLTARGGVRAKAVTIEAPFHVEGTIGFEGGSLGEGRGELAGRALSQVSASAPIPFAGLVGGGRPGELKLTIRGDASALGRPVLNLVARPAPPAESAARPARIRSWRSVVANGGGDPRALWDRLMSVAWQTAKLRIYDTYLGNPDTDGPAATIYRFALAPPAAPPEAGGPGPLPAATTTPLLAVTAVLALLLLAFDGALLWSLM